MTTIFCSGFTSKCLGDGRIRLEVEDNDHDPAPSPNTRYDKAGVAARLSALVGRSVSLRTIDSYMIRNKNPIPFHKPSGRVFFIESEISRWADGRTTKLSFL